MKNIFGDNNSIVYFVHSSLQDEFYYVITNTGNKLPAYYLIPLSGLKNVDNEKPSQGRDERQSFAKY